MRNINHCGTQTLMQLCQLHTHLGSELRVKIGQGLIHQESLRTSHNRASYRYALLLSAGQLARPSFQQ